MLGLQVDIVLFFQNMIISYNHSMFISIYHEHHKHKFLLHFNKSDGE